MATNIGNVAITGDLSVSGTYPTSDDRLKWNETPITNALDTIRLLKPQTYDKAYSIPEDGSQPENTFREAGFVAQEVLEIPELVQFVRPDGVEEVDGVTRIKPYALNYNSIFTHMIAAVKELDTIVQAQATRIAVLEAQS